MARTGAASALNAGESLSTELLQVGPRRRVPGTVALEGPRKDLSKMIKGDEMRGMAGSGLGGPPVGSQEEVAVPGKHVSKAYT